MRRRLRIASVCRVLPTPANPASGVFVANRIAAMARAADVRVMQPVPYFPLALPLPAWAGPESRQIGVLEVEHAPMFYVPRLLKSFDWWWLARAIAARIERLHRAQPLDLIDAHFGYPDGMGCVAVAHQLGIPVFVTVRGLETNYLGKSALGERLAGALRHATGCVAVSHSLRGLLVEHGVDPRRIAVIHNAVDHALFAPGPREPARERLGLPQDAFVVVSVGHLTSVKRHHILIEGFARLLQQRPESILAIVGGAGYEPDYPGQLRRQVEAAGLASKVRFVGAIAPGDVVGWLHAADVFALASAREGCCNAVLEALAVGAPVVTSPAGDNPHFVRDGENGFLAAIDDPIAFHAGLAAVARRADWDRARISATLRNQVGGWAEVGARVLEFFETCLGSGEPADAHPTRS
jgi:teichuronic acid biosynthesis glycosyltransferase TuaC